MDSRGSFDMNAYMRMIEGAKAAHLKARQYEGKKVLPWPAREQVIARFMTGLIRMEAQRSSISTSTAILPVYYLPCIFPSAELKPIFISDLTLETHHRGCKILLRVCTEICRMTGLWMIAEDEYGAAISLHLQHQPEEKVISARELLRKGTILLLKEPYFKRASDGEHVLRVDHVSDIIWLQGQDVRIPFAWKPQNIGFDSTKARLAGDNYVRKSKLGNALQQYGEAIASAQTPLDSGLAYYSRSHVNLLLGRPSSALDDVVAMKSKLEPTENGIFREAICLYKLKKFDQCYSKLQELRLLYPNNEKVQSEIVKATAKLRECNEGIYDWKDMHRQAKNSPPLVDCGTFSRNVEVRQSPGKGRGLFTAKAVAVGELLLCEKAFAYCGLDKDAEQKETILLDINTTKILTTGQTGLLSRVVQNLYHEPEMAASFLDLHDGGHPTPQKDLQVDSKPVVDTFLVANIIRFNSMAAPRSSLEYNIHGQHRDEEWTRSTSGIWCTASYMNHSCVNNCFQTFIGDMIIIRAAEDMPAGTELKIDYVQSAAWGVYGETQKRFTGLDFCCDCYLCDMKIKTSSTDRHQREAHLQSLSELAEKPILDMHRAQLLLKQVDKTYEKSGQKALKLELQVAYYEIGEALHRCGLRAEATPMLLRALEVGGFAFADGAANDPQNAAAIEIRKWGACSSAAMSSIMALQSICFQVQSLRSRFHFFITVGGSIAHQLAHFEAYAKTAHAIMAGEKETYGVSPTLG